MTRQHRIAAYALGLMLILLLLVLSLLRNESPAIAYRTNSGAIFGTQYHITYSSTTDLHAEVRGLLLRLDSSLSFFNPKSNLSLVNTNQTDHCDSFLCDVLTLAQEVTEASNGAFDITAAPLVNAWGFGFRHDSLPDSHTVDSLRQLVGHTKIAFSSPRITKASPSVIIDLGAIAKGYACDCIARLLQSRGATNWLIEIGGEIVAHGVNSAGQPWHIGIATPQEGLAADSKQVSAMLSTNDIAMATSGNYRNFYYHDGQRYAHTINPRTGYPVTHSLLSATVTAPTCAEADAFATAFMVLGADSSKALLESHPHLKAVLISTDKDGKYDIYSNLDLNP